MSVNNGAPVLAVKYYAAHVCARSVNNILRSRQITAAFSCVCIILFLCDIGVWYCALAVRDIHWSLRCGGMDCGPVLTFPDAPLWFMLFGYIAIHGLLMPLVLLVGGYVLVSGAKSRCDMAGSMESPTDTKN